MNEERKRLVALNLMVLAAPGALIVSVLRVHADASAPNTFAVAIACMATIGTAAARRRGWRDRR